MFGHVGWVGDEVVASGISDSSDVSRVGMSSKGCSFSGGVR